MPQPDSANGWQTGKLGDLVEKLSDGSHNPPPKMDMGLPMISARNVDWGTINMDSYRLITPESFELERRRAGPIEGDVLLTIVGTIGRAAVILQTTPALSLQRSVALLRPKHLNSKFLMYHLLSETTQAWLRENSKGTAQQGVYLKSLREVPISYPGLSEQAKIVEHLETQLSRLDAGIAALKRAQANLKRYRASVLKAACEGRLQSNREQQKLSDEKSPYGAALPSSWKWSTTVRACSIVVDCHNKTAPYVDDGIPLVRTTNIRNGKLKLEETKFVTQETYEFWSRRCIPRPGDLLFTREAPMGEVGMIPEDYKLCMGQRMMLLRGSNIVLGRYLLIVLQNPALLRFITQSSVGSGVQHLRVRDVENIPIPLPPLVEQEQIVAEVERLLSVADAVEASLNQHLIRATRLRQSILAKALS